jgi:hypothetical protein
VLRKQRYCYTMKEKEGFLMVIIESAGNEHYP